MHRLISKLRALPPARLMLLAEAALLLALARLLIRFAPFRLAVKAGSRGLGLRRSSDPRLVAHIRWSVDTAARELPWRMVCFPKGLALQWMCRSRGIDAKLHYGLANDSRAAPEAHVWIVGNGDLLIGGEEAERFQTVAVVP